MYTPRSSNCFHHLQNQIWNTDVVVAPSGTGMESMCGVTRSSTLNYPSMTQFNPPSNIGAFGTSQLNEIRFKIPAGSINIPGCGNSCPAYVVPLCSMIANTPGPFD